MSSKNSSVISDSGTGAAGGSKGPGPFLAKVVSHLDPSYMGSLEVEMLRPAGNDKSPGQVVRVKYLSPFYGVTNIAHNGEGNDYNSTQTSYGMWFVPPDPGCTVVVIFIDGDPKRGYWIGCVMDENMNFMLPGYAATQYHGKNTDTNTRKVVAEYNKKKTDGNPESKAHTTEYSKPVHTHFDKVLTNQGNVKEHGLSKDDIRGTTTSSARREVPSAVFGISTPGPIDKKGPKGTFGKEKQSVQAFKSRLGGSSIVMDDGDDKFIRKDIPTKEPPIYIDLEQGGNKSEGKTEIPHNELIRIRTRTGHQILLHNSEDLIYITNSKGTSWIEMTSNGKIDIYAEDSISVNSDRDINFTANRDINLTAKTGNINLNAYAGNLDINVKKNYYLTVGADQMIKVTGNSSIKADGNHIIESGGNSNIKAGGEHIEHASQIHMNGKAAAPAPTPPPTPKIQRIPKKEPYKEHENLNPKLFCDAGFLQANVNEHVDAATPFFQKPTTKRDTFNHMPKPGAKK